MESLVIQLLLWNSLLSLHNDSICIPIWKWFHLKIKRPAGLAFSLFLKIQRRVRYWKCRAINKCIITMPQGRKLIMGKIQTHQITWSLQRDELGPPAANVHSWAKTDLNNREQGSYKNPRTFSKLVATHLTVPVNYLFKNHQQRPSGVK